jgi:triphosphatase
MNVVPQSMVDGQALAVAESAPPASLSDDGAIHPPCRHRSLPPATEVELKLLAEPECLAQLDRSPPIVAHARSKGTVRLDKSIYYDTPSCALHRAGVTLRVRQSGKRLVQTVKVLPGNADGPLSRGEWENPVATMVPDFQSLMPLSSIGLLDVLSREPLQPIFTTEIRRHLRTLDLPAGVVQTAFDQGVVKAGDKTAAICEIELELKQGSAVALYELALALSEIGPVRPAMRSKAERGYDLAFGTAPAARRAGPPLSRADASVDDALAAILQSSLAQLLANQAVAEDGRDPEGIHQLRVALRRLRSALALLAAFAPSARLDALRADAKWLASSLGAARSWDVFLGEVLVEVARGCGAADDLQSLREIAEQARATSYAAARATLADARAGRFQLVLGAWIEQRGWRHDVSGETLAQLAAPATAFASSVLSARHRKVLKRGRHFKRMSLEARHELRLAVKKLRYTADFFLPLFGAPGKRYVRRLGRLQERLGRYNDAATTRQLLAGLHVDAMSGAARQAMGVVLGWQACHLVCGERDLRSVWRAFHRSAEPWSGQA